MASPRELRPRITSIASTAQITRAMQMVAAAKMRKAQQATLMTRPFAQLLYRFQRRATTHARDFTHPLLEVRDVHKRAVILVGTDKGLCGALNTNLFRVAAQFDPATTVFITAGKRAAQFVARTRRQLTAEFSFTDSPRFAEARPIASMARDMFLKGEVDQVQVVATRFVNTLTQRAGAVEFLPIGEIKGLKIPGAESEADLTADTTEYVFEPSPEATLSFLFGLYLNVLIYRVLLEARASEQSARMVAMKGATDSAADLIEDLTLEYNKLRQGNITNELLEIAGGQLGND
jgi:F-type H+-transporting ATPase subunit gamma